MNSQHKNPNIVTQSESDLYRHSAGNRDLSINENDFRCYFTMETYCVMYDLGPERRRTDQSLDSNIHCRIVNQFGNQ